MTILNFTGGETGDAIELRSVAGAFTVQSSVVRTGTYAYRLNSSGAAADFRVGMPNGTTGQEGQDFNIAAGSAAHATFAFRYAGSPPTSECMFAFRDTSGQVKIELRLTAATFLAVYNSAISLVATGTTALSADTWYQIGVTVVPGATGSYALEINGTAELSGGSFNAGTLDADYASFGYQALRDLGGKDFFYDDICIDNAALNYGEAKLSHAIGAGAASGWTTGTGSTFAEVDDPTGSDGDTSYIATATSNADHTFNMETSATIGIAGAIEAVKTMVVIRTDFTTGTSAVAHRRIFNGTGFELTPLELTTTYRTFAKVDITDPSGSGAITTADFDSIEVGMATNTLAPQTQRCTAVWLGVWSASNTTVTPTTASLVLTTFAPVVTTPVTVTPTTAALTLTTFAPTVTVAGAVQTSRPVSSTAGNWTNEGGAASLHAATADDLDATYAQLLDGDDPSTMVLDMAEIDVPTEAGDGMVIIRAATV